MFLTILILGIGGDNAHENRSSGLIVLPNIFRDVDQASKMLFFSKILARQFHTLFET